MSKYVIDSWAWIEYLEGSKSGLKVKDLILDQANEIFTHAVSAAEIISKAKRRGKDVEAIWQAINSNSKLVSFGADESKEVGLVHAEIKSKNKNFGLADSFVLTLAKKLNAKVITGDPDFKNIMGVMMV